MYLLSGKKVKKENPNDVFQGQGVVIFGGPGTIVMGQGFNNNVSIINHGNTNTY